MRFLNRLVCFWKGHDERELGPYLVYRPSSEVYYVVCARCEKTLRKWTK